MSPPSPRALLAVVPLALLAGLAAWLVLHEPGDAAGHDVEVGRADAEESPDEQSRLAPFSARDESEVAPGPARVEASPGRVDAAEVAVDPDVETITLLAGTVVVFEDDGTRVEDPSGSLRVAIGKRGGVARVDTFDVEDGRFEVTGRLGADGAVLRSMDDSPYPAPLEELECTITDVLVPGRGPMVFCDPDSRELVDARRSFAAGTADATIAVRPAPGLTLHVVDALTAAPLTGVEVHAWAGFGGSRRTHPGGIDTTRLAASATSPVPVGSIARIPGGASVTVFARANGYAWDAITIDKHDPGERTIELEPAGALEVRVHGDVPREAAVRIRDRDHGAPFIEIDLRGEELERFEGLPVGTYEVLVELGEWYDDPVVLARKSVEVVAGPATSVTVSVAERAPAQVADLAGRLVLPSGWDDERPRLRLDRLSPSSAGTLPQVVIRGAEIRRVDGAADVFRFEHRSLETGRYRLEYGRVGATLFFELPPGGRDDLLLEIAPPVDITVEVVDAETGLESTGVDALSWRALRADEGRGGSSKTVLRSPASGLFECRVPGGPVALSVLGEFQGQLTVPQATDGLHVRFEVEKRPIASVELRSGDAVIPWPGGLLMDVEAVGGEGHVNSWMSAGGHRSFGVSLPGRYRITIPTIDGFHPHDPVEVDLVAGEQTQVVVELVPK